MPSPEVFDAFKTDLKLAMLTLKQELQKDIKAASDGVLTEMRERLQRNTEERQLYNMTLDDRLKHIDKVAQETRDLARETNGQTRKHKEVLFGGDDTPGNGLVKDVKSNTNWRNALVTAGGVVSFFVWALWMFYGDDIRTRGMINRPAEDYKLYIDERIHQWIPDVPKPIVSPPALDGKKQP